MHMRRDPEELLKCSSKQVFVLRRLNEREEDEAHLLLEETVEDEDEHALQGVEDGEEVRHHDGGLVEEQQAEGPGQSQQTEEDERPRHPRPGKKTNRKGR